MSRDRNGNEQPAPPESLPLFNREISWLAFNERVLEEAFDERHPLLERVKFLSIFFSNLDEFFMIRVSGLQLQRQSGITEVAADGLAPTEVLERVAARQSELVERALGCWDNLSEALRQKRIEVVPHGELTEVEQRRMARYFDEEIFPILTPLAVDPGHPFPHISNLTLSLLVTVFGEGKERIARVKVPGSLARLTRVNPDASRRAPARFVWLEDVIAHHIGRLFPGFEPRGVYPFRVTRDADIEIQEDEAEDLLRAVESDIEKRHFSFVTRLEVTADLPEHLRRQLVTGLEMDERNVVVCGKKGVGTLGLAQLIELLSLERRDLKDPPYVPKVPAPFTSGEDIFATLARGDVLLYQPYDAFSPVLSLVQAGATDEHVLAIKQTLYRVGRNSPLVPMLIKARDADTQVAVLVELKARFDESNNIEWARRLEDAGVHVVYGLIGLKTHAKLLLIVRKEPGGIRRYVHLGTGNYNASTARLYTDFGLLTSDPEIAADVTDLFNLLTGYSKQQSFRKILVAPINLREGIKNRIERETERAREGKPARLIFQMNALVDTEMIRLLYAASQAGVRVELVIRGICCLVPGVKGVSENIRVVSLVGRYLEHARVFYFENGGQGELLMGSADLMERNLNRRVEVVFPVEDPAARSFVLDFVLPTLLADNVNARDLNPDGSYERRKPEGRKRRIDAQQLFMKGREVAVSK
jgi:polyphosphate kinase